GAAATGPALTPIYRAPDTFVPAIERFKEGCPKCRGSGRFISYSGRDCGPCFACKGAGNKPFKTSPEPRARSPQGAVERKTKALTSWCEENKAEHAWCLQAAPRFAFAQSMLDAVAKFGSLTDGQMAAVRKCMAKDAERAVEREARKAA